MQFLDFPSLSGLKERHQSQAMDLQFKIISHQLNDYGQFIECIQYSLKQANKDPILAYFALYSKSTFLRNYPSTINEVRYIMFSSLKSYQNDLLNTERFYYNNYEYYNDYENIDQKYRNDLSKIHFRLNRKIDGTIFHDFESDFSQSMQIQEQNSESQGRSLDLFHILQKLMLNFHENNYSDCTDWQPSAKVEYQFVQLKFKSHYEPQPKIEAGLESGLCQKAPLSLAQRMTVFRQTINQMIETKDVYAQAIERLDGKAEEMQMYLERWNAFENFISYFLKTLLPQSDSVFKGASKQVFEFCENLRFITERTLASVYHNSILTSLPNLKKVNKYLHPLTVGLSYTFNIFQRQQRSSRPKPKIVFLNLDGKETPYNLRFARNLGENFMYVSVFKEPCHKFKKLTKMEEEFESEYDTSFQNISECCSQMLANEAFPQRNVLYQQQHYRNKSRMLVFPLNSDYLRKQAYKKMSRTQAGDSVNLPKMSSSEDIYFLYEKIISEQITSFKPDMVFISYNGYLDIKESHFNEMVRSLTVIASQKLCLLPNFIDKKSLDGSEESDEEENEEDEEHQEIVEDEMDEFQVRNTMVVKEFMGKYMRFKAEVEYLNFERLFSNLTMFLKISSGDYCMKPRLLAPALLKYSMGDRYGYLKYLSETKEFRHFSQFLPSTLESNQIKSLYMSQGRQQLKENRKDLQSYEKIVDGVIEEFMTVETHEVKDISVKMAYRLQEVMEEQEQDSFLRYGVQEFSGNQDLSNFSSTYAIENRNKLSNRYFSEMKRLLLLEQLEGYRTRKVFYNDEENQSVHAIKCYKFCFHEDDSSELFFQKYTQIIFHPKKPAVYVVNFKEEDKHYILTGNLNNLDRKKMVKLHKISGDLGVLLKNQDNVYINFSHCFVKGKLYLYWPQAWNIKEEVRCKLLQIPYRPETQNIMVGVEAGSSHINANVQVLQHVEEECLVKPRVGCSSIESSGSNFFIFGGIYDEADDFLSIGEGFNYVQVCEIKKCFEITPIPKSSEKQLIISNREKTFGHSLPPKMHYRVERSNEHEMSSEEPIFVLSGGFGRQFTNTCHLFSNDSYSVNLATKKVEERLIGSQRFAKLPQPIDFLEVGKHFMITNNQSLGDVQERFSDLPKKVFAFQIMQREAVKSEKGPGRQVNCFIDCRYRVNEFKVDHKKLYLFGFNRTIREKIYTKFWSPELYVSDGQHNQIVHICLKTEKNPNYNISTFLMPREEDIVSMCLEEDRLFVLSCSQIIKSTEDGRQPFALYESVLSNMAEVISKHEIKMNERFDFKHQKFEFLAYKTIYVIEDKLYLFGGLSVHQNTNNLLESASQSQTMELQDSSESSGSYYREDYILDIAKFRFRIKTRKVQSKDHSVEMISPMVVKHNESLYLYSLELFQCSVQREASEYPEIEDHWKIKIEHFVSDSASQSFCVSQFAQFYAVDADSNNLQRITPELKVPKFVVIAKYEYFSIARVREYLSKVIFRLNKMESLNEDLQGFFQKSTLLFKEPDSQSVRSTLLQNTGFFKDFMKSVVKESKNLEEQNLSPQEFTELLKDLKVLYSFVNKLMLEELLGRVESQFGQQDKEREEMVSKMEHLSILSNEEETNYFFVVEDRELSKIRYMGIGQLNDPRIKLLRVRFRHNVSISLNKQEEQGLYFHPTVSGYQELEFVDRYYQYQLVDDEYQKRERQLERQQYKIHSQIKI